MDDMVKLNNEDYGYCEDCEEYIDLWRTEGDWGEHNNHKHRFVTNEELKSCIQDCKDFGCFNDEQ